MQGEDGVSEEYIEVSEYDRAYGMVKDKNEKTYETCQSSPILQYP
jgi:hypothetical protein